MRKHFLLLAVMLLLIAVGARADSIRIWEADSGLGGIADKATINSYLDNLKAHSVNGVWIQVELYSDGAVNYKKTTLSKLPTAKKFTTGQWADDDFLAYVISQARSRGMKPMIKFHGSNHAAWDKHPDWRKRDSNGKEVLWNGTLKNFCVNSPYWDTMFMPMVKEIAANYDVDGFYLDTCQVAYETSDCCFCPFCKARFEKETGKKLPAKSVDKANWADPLVKQYAVKRVEWVNSFYEKYSQAVREVKPTAEILLNASGGYNSYKDTVSSRHAGAYVTSLTPEPVSTPRMYAAVRNQALVKAKQKPASEDDLASEDMVTAMDHYGYMQFTTKLMLADGGLKPVVPFSRYWFTDESGMASTNVAIKEIESAVGAGAKGWCFFGYLAHALETGAAKKGAWADPKFAEYLKDLATGPRSQWIADWQPDSRVAILVDRDASFWNADYWDGFKDIGRLYSFLQYERKFSISLLSTGEPNLPGFRGTGYKLTKEMLSQYNLIFCPGLDYATVEDLQALKDYYDSGGKLIIMGPVGTHGTGIGKSLESDAYRLLGLCTVGGPTPSGFIKPITAQSPVFMRPGGFTGPQGTFRYSADKETALSYDIKYDESKYEILAHEFADNGKRVAMLYGRDSHFDLRKGAIAYVNTAMMREVTPDMLIVLMNMSVVVSGRTDTLFPVGFTAKSSVNAFRSADGMTRYFHIFTPDGETDETLRVRANPNTYPVKAEIIINGGQPKSIPIVEASREPEPNEMVVSTKGSGTLNPGPLPAGFAVIRVEYEHRDFGAPKPVPK